MTLRSMRLKRQQAAQAKQAAAVQPVRATTLAASAVVTPPPPSPTSDSGPGNNAQHVQRVLEQASYFIIFTVPDPQSLSVGTNLIPFIPQTVFKIAITEAPRRAQVTVKGPTPTCGFRTNSAISKRQIATQNLDMEVCPNDFESGPGRTPPPTLLLPLTSQRFWMLNGHFDFLDGEGTGFRAIAGGRFFPGPNLSFLIGGVADIVEGLGQLEGFSGNLAINGVTTPPSTFANLFLFRFVDPLGKLTAKELPPVIPEEPDPDYTDSSVLPISVEPDPKHPLKVEPMPEGTKQQFHIVERLRIADTNFNVAPAFLKSKTVLGDVIGYRKTTLIFDPNDPNDTIPCYSVNSVFHFFAGDTPIGTLEVDLAEARMFRSTSPELKNPYFRITGFGPYGKGTGQFKDVQGMMSLNGAISLEPYAYSAMYMLRILDPLGVFRDVDNPG